MAKTDLLRVRLSPADKRRLAAAARREHLALSQWVRRLLLIAATSYKDGDLAGASSRTASPAP